MPDHSSNFKHGVENFLPVDVNVGVALLGVYHASPRAITTNVAHRQEGAQSADGLIDNPLGRRRSVVAVTQMSADGGDQFLGGDGKLGRDRRRVHEVGIKVAGKGGKSGANLTGRDGMRRRRSLPFPPSSPVSNPS